MWRLPALLACLAAVLRPATADAAADEVVLLQGMVGVASTGSPGVQGKNDRHAEGTVVDSASFGFKRQPMINFADAQYVSNIKLGKQVITGILDTGSFELVVFGASCASCGPAAHYNERLSETYSAGKLHTTHNYGSGGTVCREGFEKVQIGPAEPKEQMFWYVEDASMPVLANAAFESIIGVGPPEAPLAEIWEAATEAVTDLTTIYSDSTDTPNDKVERAHELVEIGLHLNRNTPMLSQLKVDIFSVCMGALSGTNGVFIWNDTIALERPELFKKVPVTSNHTWAGNLTEPHLAGENMTLGCPEGCEALIDSGTSLLAVPEAVLNRIQAQVEALDPNCTHPETLPSLEFKLGGVSFSLPPSAYLAEVTDDVPAAMQQAMPHLKRQGCSVMLLGMTRPMWILGVPWFKKYYTTFSLGRNLQERTFHIAQHSEASCEPMDRGAKYRKWASGRLAMPRVDPKKLLLPKIALEPFKRNFSSSQQ